MVIKRGKEWCGEVEEGKGQISDDGRRHDMTWCGVCTIQYTDMMELYT